MTPADVALQDVELLRRTLLRAAFDGAPSWPVAEQMALAGAAAACAGFNTLLSKRVCVADLDHEQLLTLAGVYELASRAVASANIMAIECCDPGQLEEFKIAVKLAHAGSPALRRYVYERETQRRIVTSAEALDAERCPVRASYADESRCLLPAGHDTASSLHPLHVFRRERDAK